MALLLHNHSHFSRCSGNSERWPQPGTVLLGQTQLARRGPACLANPARRRPKRCVGSLTAPGERAFLRGMDAAGVQPCPLAHTRHSAGHRHLLSLSAAYRKTLTKKQRAAPLPTRDHEARRGSAPPASVGSLSHNGDIRGAAPGGTSLTLSGKACPDAPLLRYGRAGQGVRDKALDPVRGAASRRELPRCPRPGRAEGGAGRGRALAGRSDGACAVRRRRRDGGGAPGGHGGAGARCAGARAAARGGRAPGQRGARTRGHTHRYRQRPKDPQRSTEIHHRKGRGPSRTLRRTELPALPGAPGQPRGLCCSVPRDPLALSDGRHAE